MKKIDRETVQRILDTADIVEVVSDFVTLKRRGANYIGLCPFHNERTPSFSVSKSKGICKCFSCGNGGSPVNFLMELEQMSYYEALKWLAKKYGIEIKEREMTDKERTEEHERESMLAVNDFALKHFEHTMADTDDGQNIGLAYFRERGINDQSIKKFHLGYSLEKSDDLYKSAIAKGFKEEFLISTGLCAKSERGVYDRFRGRVIYPVHSVSGRVVAFGGRTLRKDKNVAKYVNSPESIIYSKSRELYGLYQAKQAITKKDKCILVEGYMDVISMHQSGVENVVASSGTSLTEGQIRLIHRFTNNVTVIYDADAAGIKASLRGIDMLLAEGINVKVLQLPEGDDPDSYSQNHTSEELEQYLSEHETDFIRFKSDILLKDAQNDPIRRANVISEIVRTISVIPDGITRQVYIDECSRMLNISDSVLAQQLKKFMAERLEKEVERRERAAAEEDIKPILDAPVASTTTVEQPETTQTEAAKPEQATQAAQPQQTAAINSRRASYLNTYEREVLRYTLRYGLLPLCEAFDEEGRPSPMSVIDFIENELRSDCISFVSEVNNATWRKAVDIARGAWREDQLKYEDVLVEKREAALREGQEKIRQEASDLADIHARELQLNDSLDERVKKARAFYARHYIERILCSDSNDTVRRLTTDLVSDKYTLSKVHTKYSHVETEEEKLPDLVPRAVYELKNAILTCDITETQQLIQQVATTGDTQKLSKLIQELIDLNNLKGDFAKYLGERIITPRKM
jgi:DNA primase